MKVLTARNAALAVGAATAACSLTMAMRRRSEEFDLNGMVVLITGGSRGFGLALAREFGEHGARLALCARDPDELERALIDLSSRDIPVFTYQCDVSDPAQVNEMVQAARRHYGQLDVLVNNAGVIDVGPLRTMTLGDFHRAMDIMFWGTVHTTLAVLPHMLERGKGRIVNITSVGGKVSVPHLLPYSCAKFAVVAFSEGLRAELSRTRVKSITIAPGLMRTGSYLNSHFKGDDEREATWFSLSASIPGVSISARRAAKQVIAATRRGTAEKILSLPANLLVLFHGVLPGATADLLGLLSRGLPNGQGENSRAMKSHIQSNRLLNLLTTLGRRAAGQYLQDRVSEESLAR
jgi:NAD(P)-dependent dehydrogenase (short-subunit alcohol dehydrogenase family)